MPKVVLQQAHLRAIDTRRLRLPIERVALIQKI